jgi:hypothetical protein
MYAIYGKTIYYKKQKYTARVRVVYLNWFELRVKGVEEVKDHTSNPRDLELP